MNQTTHRAIKKGDSVLIFTLFYQASASIVSLLLLTIVQLLQKCRCSILLMIFSVIRFASPNNMNRGGVSFAELWMTTLSNKTTRLLKLIEFKELFSSETDLEKFSFATFSHIPSIIGEKLSSIMMVIINK